jgi:hypothetical protein
MMDRKNRLIFSLFTVPFGTSEPAGGKNSRDRPGSEKVKKSQPAGGQKFLKKKIRGVWGSDLRACKPPPLLGAPGSQITKVELRSPLLSHNISYTQPFSYASAYTSAACCDCGALNITHCFGPQPVGACTPQAVLRGGVRRGVGLVRGVNPQFEA